MFYGLWQDHETHGLRVVEPQGRCGRELPGLDAADAGADDFCSGIKKNTQKRSRTRGTERMAFTYAEASVLSHHL